MRRAAAVIGTAIFLVFVPCVVAGVVPRWISHWEFRLSFLGVELTRFVGSALILAGVSGLVDSFGRFALQGLGTPAPIAPTQHLVVTGLYRYVRNPIYVRSPPSFSARRSCLAIGGCSPTARSSASSATCLSCYEDPTLKKSFGAEYEAFRINVPRWIPRLTAWRGGR